MIVVDPDVTRAKFERELDLWHANEEAYGRRGWILLARRELAVDVGFLGRVSLGAQHISAMTACVRIDFTNYDLWPPSVEFIDPFRGEFAPPIVPALIDSAEGPRNLLVSGHPDTNRPFFCVPGVREYHDHPQHSGDSWLLHRKTGAGSLATICDRIWRTMARNVLGVQIVTQTLPGTGQLELRVANAPGEIAPMMWQQADQAARAAQSGIVFPTGGGLPPQLLAALGFPPAPLAVPCN